MKNAILKIVKKTGGLKFTALIERLNKGDDEVTPKEIRPLVAELAAEQKVVLVEYKLQDTTDPKMFILPEGTDVLSADEVEVETRLPSEMFTGFAVFSGSFTGGDGQFCADSIQAQAKLLKEVGEGKNAQAYGLIPLKVESILVLDETSQPPAPETNTVTVNPETQAAE